MAHHCISLSLHIMSLYNRIIIPFNPERESREADIILLLTINYTGKSADELGYLLHKNPANVQTFSLSFGKAHVFYPEVNEQSCTFALCLDVDTIGLLRKQKQQRKTRTLQHYVNDRPYVASSFFSVALAKVLGSALNGHSKDRPILAKQKLSLQASLSVVSCRGGETLLRRLFEPLGYQMKVERLPLDEQFPEWGESHYYRLGLKQKVRLQDLLSHLYVFLPVLDNNKHYWVQKDEEDKLLRHSEVWLQDHPEKEFIVRRYLNHQRSLADSVLNKWKLPEKAHNDVTQSKVIEESPVRLNQLRLQAVTTEILQLQATKILDLGCGEGKLIAHLLRSTSVKKITGIDPSYRSLIIAKEKVAQIVSTTSEIEFLTGSVYYRDSRLKHFDVAVLMEVIEHLDPERLTVMEEICFAHNKPLHMIVTTPNREYNTEYSGLSEGKLRHADHRFEWTREQFQAWAHRVASQYHYQVRFAGIGLEVETLGYPTQMAIFTLEGVVNHAN